MAGGSSAGQHRYIAAIDEKAWAGPRGSARRPGFPQREPALPTETARSRVREAQVESSFWSGAGSQPVAAAGDRL